MDQPVGHGHVPNVRLFGAQLRAVLGKGYSVPLVVRDIEDPASGRIRDLRFRKVALFPLRDRNCFGDFRLPFSTKLLLRNADLVYG
jgi:hypothetical protein